MPYLGPEWGREAVALLRSDPAVRAAVEGVEATLLIRITGAPAGRYGWLHATFSGGGVEARMGRDEAGLEGLPEPAFTVRGPYATFAAIQRGETTEQRAFLAGDLKVEGNRLRALRLLGPLSAVTAALARIECEA